MKKFIQKYSFVIIVFLCFLLACKSCQSSSKSRQFDASATKSEAVIDSIKNINKELTDSIRVLNTQLKAKDELNAEISTSLNHVRQTNRSLVNSIKSTK